MWTVRSGELGAGGDEVWPGAPPSHSLLIQLPVILIAMYFYTTL
jgi:hypothetical protein